MGSHQMCGKKSKSTKKLKKRKSTSEVHVKRCQHCKKIVDKIVNRFHKGKKYALCDRDYQYLWAKQKLRELKCECCEDVFVSGKEKRFRMVDGKGMLLCKYCYRYHWANGTLRSPKVLKQQKEKLKTKKVKDEQKASEKTIKKENTKRKISKKKKVIKVICTRKEKKKVIKAICTQKEIKKKNSSKKQIFPIKENTKRKISKKKKVIKAICTKKEKKKVIKVICTQKEKEKKESAKKLIFPKANIQRKISKKKKVIKSICTQKEKDSSKKHIPPKIRRSQRIKLQKKIFFQSKQNQTIMKKESLPSFSQPISPLEIESIPTTISSSQSSPISLLMNTISSKNMNQSSFQSSLSQLQIQDKSVADDIAIKKDYWYETDSEDEMMVSKTSQELCCITQEHREKLEQMERQIQNLMVENLNAEKYYQEQLQKYECATKNRQRIRNELALLQMRLHYKKKLFLNFDF